MRSRYRYLGRAYDLAVTLSQLRGGVAVATLIREACFIYFQAEIERITKYGSAMPTASPDNALEPLETLPVIDAQDDLEDDFLANFSKDLGL